MATQRSIITLFTGFLLAAGVGLVPPAQAGDVTVTEGGTATFQVTVTRKPGIFFPSDRIRVYYADHGDTATRGTSDHGVGVDGADYPWLNPWVHYVEGGIGQPLTISVPTFADDLVEGDETFKIRAVGIRALTQWWQNTPLPTWNVNGLPTTVTIQDATPAPAPEPINWGLAACYWSGC